MGAIETQYTTETKLERIAWLSRQDSTKTFKCVMHHINEESLKVCYHQVNGKAAVGIDGVNKESYGKELEENLRKLISSMEQLISNHIKEYKDLSDKGRLLDSIPGIGEKTIAIVLAFLSNVEDFDSAKQVVAFVGLNPKPRQSGSSVNGVGRISETGDSDLRKAFYCPALTAIKFNPIIKDFSERLSRKGKGRMVIIIVAMRKLLHIIYGVLKTRTYFKS